MKQLGYKLAILLILQPFTFSNLFSQSLTTWNYHYGSLIVKDAEYFKYMQEVARQNYEYKKAKGEDQFALAIEAYNAKEYKEALYHLKDLYFIGLRTQVHKLRTYCYISLEKCGKAKKEAKKIKQYDYKLWKQVTQEAKTNCQ